LFHAATVPGILPSECSPRRRSAPLSRPLAPLQLSTDVLNRAARDRITARFTDSQRFHASCLDPQTTMSSLSSPPRGRFPVTLGLNRRNRFVPSASPASKPSSSYESVRTGSGCPSPMVDPLLSFSPSRAFQFTPRTLHPTRPRSDLASELPPRNATQRILRPPKPGEHRPIQSCKEQSSSAVSDPLRDQPVPPRRWPVLLPQS